MPSSCGKQTLLIAKRGWECRKALLYFASTILARRLTSLPLPRTPVFLNQDERQQSINSTFHSFCRKALGKFPSWKRVRWGSVRAALLGTCSQGKFSCLPVERDFKRGLVRVMRCVPKCGPMYILLQNNSIFREGWGKCIVISLLEIHPVHCHVKPYWEETYFCLIMQDFQKLFDHITVFKISFKCFFIYFASM